MPKDIFNREIGLHKGLSHDGVWVSFGADIAEFAVIQRFDVQYSQNIGRLWSVTNDNTYFVAGRQTGVATLNSALMSSTEDRKFICKYGDVCNTKNVIDLGFARKCGKHDESASGALNEAGDVLQATHKLTGVVIEALTFSVEAQSMIITEQVRMQFARMNLIPECTDAERAGTS